ncbi:MAG: M61 family metallopeptidase [Candidatus Berkiellales bacterium]
MIYFYVNSHQPNAHLYNIRMVITTPAPQQKISLPNWIPGSYLIRDFARHVVSLNAYAGEGGDLTPLRVSKIDSNTWECEKCEGPITLEYSVYALDLSVRGAHLDNEHAFFNGCCIFLQAHDQADAKYKIKISPPAIDDATKWRVATTLPKEDAIDWGYGWYRASSYEELIDHPVEIGHFASVEFKVNGVDHRIVVSGQQGGDLNRLKQDIHKICETHMHLFGGLAPFDRYLFLLAIRKEAYGGLEHQSSCALQISRDSLPGEGEPGVSNDYLNLLGLFSHEYFHAWNVKKFKPLAFLPYPLDEKAYTEQLWAVEGITSYYDNLALIRAKVIPIQMYLDLLARSITKLLHNPGRQKQTITQASFDAWIKYYQPNENSNNATVSYYLKGSLIALALDLALRLATSHQFSLGEVMKRLMVTYGQNNRGIPEGEIEKIIAELGGQKLAELLHLALYTTEDLPLAELLSQFGLSLTLREAYDHEDQGGKNIKNESTTHKLKRGIFGWSLLKNDNRVIVAHVLDNSAALQAGVIPNDEIIALNGIKVECGSIDKVMNRFRAGDKVKVTLFRQDVLKELMLILQTPTLDTAEITLKDTLSIAEKANLDQWLMK